MAATKKKTVKKTVKAKAVSKAKTSSAVKVKPKARAVVKKTTAKTQAAATPAAKVVTRPKTTNPLTSGQQVAKKPTASQSTEPSNKPTAVKSVKSTNNLSDSLGYTDFTPYEIQTGEDYMNPEQVDHFREILTSWKNELMAKVDETVHHMQDEAANFPDPNDRATQESDFTMELRTRDRERKLIKKIEESLTALENEEYGYCVSCGIEVGIRRLEARPTASECIDCKTLNEIKEKQYGK